MQGDCYLSHTPVQWKVCPLVATFWLWDNQFWWGRQDVREHESSPAPDSLLFSKRYCADGVDAVWLISVIWPQMFYRKAHFRCGVIIVRKGLLYQTWDGKTHPKKCENNDSWTSSWDRDLCILWCHTFTLVVRSSFYHRGSECMKLHLFFYSNSF